MHPLIKRRKVLLVSSDPNAPAALRRRWGQAITERRTELGVTRHELAAAVGVTDQAVGTWERGEAAPTPARQVAIAHALEVPWAHLFTPGAIAC